MSNLSQTVWPTSDFSRIPLAVYSDPDLYLLEQERIYRGPVWNYLALQAEIPNPNDFKTAYVGDTPVVITRAEDGSLHAFVNRCAHKGTMVVREPHGSRPSHTCVYHHWRYDPTGELISVPFERGVAGQGGMPESFDKAQHGLRTLRVETCSEAIFGSFDDDVEPLEDYLDAPVWSYINRIFRKPIEILGHMRERIPGNWKAYFENLTDGYHAGLLHTMPVVFGIHRLTQETELVMDKMGRHLACYVVEDTDDPETIAEGYSDTARGQQIAEPMKLNDPAFLTYRDEVGDGHTIRTWGIFPSAMMHQLSNSLSTQQIRPKGPGEFELYSTLFGYVDDDPDLRRLRQLHIALTGPGGCISMEDAEASALMKRALPQGVDQLSVLEMGGLGTIESQDNMITEVPVRGFWRYYCHLMGIKTEDESNWPPAM